MVIMEDKNKEDVSSVSKNSCDLTSSFKIALKDIQSSQIIDCKFDDESIQPHRRSWRAETNAVSVTQILFLSEYLTVVTEIYIEDWMEM